MSDSGSAAPTAWLELRVHGVSGTPVKDMLALPGRPALPGKNIKCIAGGKGTGQLWRRGDVAAPGELEAYHWGEYTSQSPWKAFWVLLLPFGIVNTAQFMLPEARDTLPKLLHALAGSCLRVIALALSGLAFLSLAFVTMDLIGWYGIGQRVGRCYGAVALCALVLAVFLGLIGQLSRQPRDGQSPAAPESSLPAGPDAAAAGLHREQFYTGAVRSPDARRLHSAAILAMLALLTAWPGADAADADLRAARAWATTLLLVVAAVVAVSGDPEGGSSVELSGKLEAAVRWLQATVLKVVSWSGWLGSIGLLLWTANSARQLRLHPARPVETLLGFDEVATWLLVAALGALAGLLVMVVLLALITRQATGDRDRQAYVFRRYASGLATWFIAAVAVFVGVGYAGAFAVLPAVVNGVWDRFSFHHPRGAFHIPFPTILQRVLFAWGWTFIALVSFGVAVVASYRMQQRGRYRKAATAAYGEFGPLPPEVTNRTGLWMFCARLKNLIPLAAVSFGTFGAVLSLAAAVEKFRWPGYRSSVVRLLAGSGGWAVVCLQIAGTLALTALVIGVGWETYSAFHSDNARRSLNIVWDVICFWPRSVHPLVPGAYSQFVVAELRQYVSGALARDEHPEVVVAAHSQGSLISLAALLWLPQAERDRVGFLSFGSQLRQIYPRAFPAYVNVAVLDQVQTSIGKRWLNLYRDTDHIAGPLFSWAHRRTQCETQPAAAGWPDEQRCADGQGPHGRRTHGPEWRLLDPMLAAADGPPAADAKPEKHSNYWLDTCWDEAIYAVRASSPPDLRPWAS